MSRTDGIIEALRDFYNGRQFDDDKYAHINGECWKLLDRVPEGHSILDATGKPIPNQYWAPSEEGGERYPNLFFTVHFLFNNRSYEYVYRTRRGEIYMNYADGEAIDDDEALVFDADEDERLMPDETMILGPEIHAIRGSGARFLMINTSCLQTKAQYRRHLR